MPKLPRCTIPAPLDPHFSPAALFNRNYKSKVETSGKGVPLVLALERESGRITRIETHILQEADSETSLYVDRLVKSMIWTIGGWRLYVAGPKSICSSIKKTFSAKGDRAFDCKMMELSYGKKFEVKVLRAEDIPLSNEVEMRAGGHLTGCRIGFDLGASDYKVAAVIDGKTVFTEETPWNPKIQENPAYHYHHISSALHRAAAHLPRVDAIGGSSAGVIVDNEIRVASLIRSIPQKKFSEASGVFKRLQREWNVPLVVMNDGDVTALAGSMSLGKNGMLGIAMGSSEAAGYMDNDGRIHGWLNELAFAPMDFNPKAAVCEWSGDRGVGALYFSQQAVNKLLPAAKIRLPKSMDLPERLVEVQRLMEAGDERAAKIYETIGVYLGYTIPHYLDFYDFTNLLILGRVTTGTGGDVVISKAREILFSEFPEHAPQITIHVPDEKSRRVGQAVAAASLPILKSFVR